MSPKELYCKVLPEINFGLIHNTCSHSNNSSDRQGKHFTKTFIDGEPPN